MITKRFHSWIFKARWHYVQIKRSGLEQRLRYIATPFRNRLYLPHNGNDRTGYIIGLFGTGRLYLWELLMQNIGRRARYLRDDGVRVCKRPTSMIYVGHATMKYLSRAQAPPTVTSRILQAVKSRSADLIFIYRHPLDSLLTNWASSAESVGSFRFWKSCKRVIHGDLHRVAGAKTIRASGDHS